METAERKTTVRELDVPACPRGDDHVELLEDCVTNRLRAIAGGRTDLQMKEAAVLCHRCGKAIPFELDSRVG